MFSSSCSFGDDESILFPVYILCGEHPARGAIADLLKKNFPDKSRNAENNINQ
jgi:hypothetical protein